MKNLKEDNATYSLRKIRAFFSVFGDQVEQLYIDFHDIEHYRKRTLSLMQKWSTTIAIEMVNEPDENEEEEWTRLNNDPIEQERLLAEFCGDAVDDPDECVIIEPI